MVEFFVPNAPDGDSEAMYQDILKFYGLPEPAQRVRRIEFRHDSEDWVAEVGGKFEGTSQVERRRNGQRVTVPERIPGGATVLAIVPGHPYQVVLDKRPFGTSHSEWESCFFAGQPSEVELFDLAAEEQPDDALQPPPA